MEFYTMTERTSRSQPDDETFFTWPFISFQCDLISNLGSFKFIYNWFCTHINVKSDVFIQKLIQFNKLNSSLINVYF